MADFTEGEWEVRESHSAPLVVIKDKPNRPDKVIAKCMLQVGSEDMAQAEANANLISAAPDMYEALKELLRYNPYEFSNRGQHWETAIEALAKAEGKQ